MPHTPLSDDAFAQALHEAEQTSEMAARAAWDECRAHKGPKLSEQSSGVDVLREILAHRGWDERAGQVQMVRDIDELSEGDPDAYGRGTVAMVAPVGTGKTLGYLAPALARGGRVVVATSTKALQDQIVGEELPRLASDLRAAFGYNLSFAVLKGKSNYACLSHLDQRIATYESQASQMAAHQGKSLIKGEAETTDQELAALKVIAQRTRIALATRNVAEYDAGTLLSALPHETQKAVNAKHSCPSRKIDLSEKTLDEVAKDRTDPWRAAYCDAMTADVVVMNTALLVEEVRKQNNKPHPNIASVLEGVSTVIIDEAHHAPNIVTAAFSAKIVASDAIKLAEAVDKRAPADRRGAAMITQTFISRVDTADHEAKFEADLNVAVAQACETFVKDIEAVLERLPVREERKLADAVGDFRENVLDIVRDAGILAKRVIDRDGKQVYTSRVSVTDQPPLAGDFELAVVPVDVSFFRQRLVTAVTSKPVPGARDCPRKDRAFVLSSGTLNANTPRLLGLGGGSVMRMVESPFDPARARMCVPRDLPLLGGGANDEAWFEDAWKAAKRAITAAGGRTLFLCTSNAKVRAFAERAAAELPFQVLRQDQGSRSQLITKFAADESSILVATMGYWEGIDVPGPALSLVVIDKMPFPLPNDAIMKAREQWVTAEGGNAFTVVNVSHVSTMLAQGAGRLIRSEGDVGGVLLLDSRAVVKRYGPKALEQIESRWLLYEDLDGFVGWMEAVRDALDAGDPDAVLDHSERGTRELRPRSRSRLARR